MQHGIDESKVREGLRKVSEMPARRRIQLLSIEPKVACFLNQSLAQFACAIRLTYLGQSRDQPERAKSETRLWLLKAVVGNVYPISPNQSVVSEIVGNGQHS